MTSGAVGCERPSGSTCFPAIFLGAETNLCSKQKIIRFGFFKKERRAVLLRFGTHLRKDSFRRNSMYSALGLPLFTYIKVGCLAFGT